MKQEIIMAGFGGQGIMSMGKILAYAGMKEGKEVSWMPSYGPEMRGGTANCTVVVSDSKIPSPLTSRPDVIIVMNLPSLDKFVDQVKAGGAVFYNSSLISRGIKRGEVEAFDLPANEIARELGNNRIANMVMLGAFIEFSGLVALEAIVNSLEHVLSSRSHDLIPLNKKALDRGRELI